MSIEGAEISNLKKEKKKTGYTVNQSIIVLINKSRVLRSFFDFFCKNILLLDATLLFIPYDGKFYVHDKLELAWKIDAEPIELLHGWCMAYRREVFLKEKFEDNLLFYMGGKS